MWHWHGDDGGWSGWAGGDWFGMALMMVFIWLPILIAAFFLVRALTGPRGNGGEARVPAEEEARRAYARGDIDRERFLQVIRDLQEHAPPPR